MFTRKHIAATAVAGLAVLGLTACDPDTTSGHPAPVSRMADAASTYTAPTSRMPIARSATPAKPLSTNGRWKVPEQIGYGTYAVTPTSDLGGYWEQTATVGAEPGDPGFIDNDFITGPDFVTITPETKYIKLDDVVLTLEG
ncbi:hypothetical protein [Nocardia spumae]|uniref:hypothetical protein n=1 Tax=Nocardia spumae TaxID=2887190 RepID=UPI001D133431|nr:hypothetical protein [Nocardia spumae]